MEKLIRHLEVFSRWLQRLVHRITPHGTHACAIHGAAWIRTFKRTGKLCVHCHEEPMKHFEEDRGQISSDKTVLYDLVVTPQGIELKPC